MRQNCLYCNKKKVKIVRSFKYFSLCLPDTLKSVEHYLLISHRHFGLQSQMTLPELTEYNILTNKYSLKLLKYYDSVHLNVKNTEHFCAEFSDMPLQTQKSYTFKTTPMYNEILKEEREIRFPNSEYRSNSGYNNNKKEDPLDVFLDIDTENKPF